MDPALEQVFFKGVSVHDDVEIDVLYKFYKDNIESLSNIPIGDSRRVDINGQEVLAKRVTNKYVLFVNIDTYEAEALFSVRSSNRDVRKTMAELQGIYGQDFSFEIKDFETEKDMEDIKPSLDKKIAECRAASNVSMIYKDKEFER